MVVVAVSNELVCVEFSLLTGNLRRILHFLVGFGHFR